MTALWLFIALVVVMPIVGHLIGGYLFERYFHEPDQRDGTRHVAAPTSGNVQDRPDRCTGNCGSDCRGKRR